MKKKKGKNKHGGPGRGQGRKPRFKGKTKQVKFLPPEVKVDELKDIVEVVFKKWEGEGW